MNETKSSAPSHRYVSFQSEYPAIAKAHADLGAAVRAAGSLSARETAIAKLALAIAAGLEGATHAHTRGALAAGVSAQEVEQVALLACSTLGFPRMMTGLGWIRDVTVKL